MTFEPKRGPLLELSGGPLADARRQLSWFELSGGAARRELR